MKNSTPFALIFITVLGMTFNNAIAQEGMPSDQHLYFDNALPAPVDGGFRMDDYWIWGSSVIDGGDGTYHMFVSRWPKKLPFHPGWMVASEIVHAVSKTVEGPYMFHDVALPARGAQYWDGRSTHNPRITKFENTYILFYMGSTHPFKDVDSASLTLQSPHTTVARSNKRIGIATSKSLYGPWERQDVPLLQTKPGTFYSFLTSNPAPWINADGSVILVFKSRAYKDEFPFHGDMSIGVATAVRYNGPYKVHDEPIFSKDRNGEVEDPFLWRDNDGFHLLVKDQRGGITGQKHSGLIAHSNDGILWTLEKNPLAYTKEIKWSDGSIQEMGQLERAFGLIQNGTLTHLFFAAMDGPGGFNNATRSWNVVVPLKHRP